MKKIAHRLASLLAILGLAALTINVGAQPGGPGAGGPGGPGGRGGFGQGAPGGPGGPGGFGQGGPGGRRGGGPAEPTIPADRSVQRAADDVKLFPDPPADFKTEKEGIPHGEVKVVTYESKTVGTERKMTVYTPPNYDPDTKYPVVFLLHGIGGDETEWMRFSQPNVMLDNLLAEGKAVPMILVMPNGRAQANDRAEGNVYAGADAFARFERDLIDDLMPALEKEFSVSTDREQRAIAGLSMGGGQSLNFGLGNLDLFAWVGGFSSAPNTKAPSELIPDANAAREKLKLLWLACGTSDGLFRISRNFHEYLVQNNVPHIWNVTSGGHDAQEWSYQLYWFLQHVFNENPPKPEAASEEKVALKDAFDGFFLIGGALNRSLVTGRDPEAARIAATHFNTVTSENDMKWAALQPRQGQFNWGPADSFVEFAEANGMAVIGHTLIWHASAPRWVFEDENGQEVTREELLRRMEEHITTVVGRYRGRVKGWDVVNEALNDNGTLRETRWMQIISEGKPEQRYDHIIKAFEFAQKADPDVELYYNDYSLESSRAKCDAAVEIVKILQERGIRIDGVGIQLHAGLRNPTPESLEYAIQKIADAGVQVMVTELDVRTQTRGYRGADPSRVNRQATEDANAANEETQRQLAEQYAQIFRTLVKHRDVVTRVTFWGVYDATSWIGGSPLLFDRNYQPKLAFDAVIEVAREAKAGGNS